MGKGSVWYRWDVQVEVFGGTRVYSRWAGENVKRHLHRYGGRRRSDGLKRWGARGPRTEPRRVVPHLRDGQKRQVWWLRNRVKGFQEQSTVSNSATQVECGKSEERSIAFNQTVVGERAKNSFRAVSEEQLPVGLKTTGVGCGKHPESWQ